MPEESKHIELSVLEPLGVDRPAYPITTGVPFPQGALRTEANLRVEGRKQRTSSSDAHPSHLAGWQHQMGPSWTFRPTWRRGRITAAICFTATTSRRLKRPSMK